MWDDPSPSQSDPAPTHGGGATGGGAYGGGGGALMMQGQAGALLGQILAPLVGGGVMGMDTGLGMGMAEGATAFDGGDAGGGFGSVLAALEQGGMAGAGPPGDGAAAGAFAGGDDSFLY